MEDFKRTIQVYKNHFWDFYNAQSERVQSKIDWTLGLVRNLRIVPKTYFDYLTGTDGLWEVRIKVGSDIFRVFCCFDEGNLVILFSGFQKKTQKTPKKEIEKAERLKKEYFDGKTK
ncbi:type II toxin-antitoxin system RelE/ParE family toxin [Marinilabiliaceae bacterium JC017]|nr:type II toxin-antitoxin system RelE/ParE family toxin [Marinilabiliaceae bacterium JC017]